MSIDSVMFRSKLPGPIAVIDVETTGLFPLRRDRVIEVAAVVIQDDGRIEREFVSLVNPCRDIGPTSVHGLTSEDILDAPQFAEIAAQLVETLTGTIAIAAHNVRFDRQFLNNEFSLIGFPLPDYPDICTMRLAGGGALTECCDRYRIPFDGESHQALADARAAALLLAHLLLDESRPTPVVSAHVPIPWPNVPRSSKEPVTRQESRRRQAAPPTFLQHLLGRRQGSASSNSANGTVTAYRALLDRVLEDRHVDDSEGEELIEMATFWGLSSDQIRLAHSEYLNEIVQVAMADGIITDAERRDLELVARLLGQGQAELGGLLSNAAAGFGEKPIQASPNGIESSLAGSRVCFTGEFQCSYQGEAISRKQAQQLANNAGLHVVDSVTKKLDLLVVTDPQTQSGKAKKARKYGIRIMHEPVFWKTLGLEVN